MDGREFDNRRRIGSTKAAINLYGENIFEGNSVMKKPPLNLSQPSPRTGELHHARRDIGRFGESKRVAESAKAQAEQELYDANKAVKDLALRIEESNSRAKTIQDLKKLKKPKSGEEEWTVAVSNGTENYQYAEVMRELEYIKHELSKLKLDMATVLDEKRRAEKETEASSSKMWSYSSSVEALTKEIEDLNEEHVLVELARIEALKEYGAIEVQRKEEAKQYSSAIEETKVKMNDVIQEIDRVKEINMKLTVTTSDVNVLQNELKLVKEIDKRDQGKQQNGEESCSPPLLESVTEELEAAKKELASIREEGFQFMASMDVVRDELKHIEEETTRLKKTEKKTDSTVQNLNSKLLRAKAKLEAVSAAEEKGKSIVSNLSLTLEQLKTEAEAAKKEKVLTSEETVTIKAEAQKMESEIDLTEERLQAAMQELLAVKSSESKALENLKTHTENTMRARASSSQHRSTITISSFEYEYLKGHAAGAEEIADKKVAAAQAWIEALKASEKEILMKTEISQREIREQRLEEQQEAYRTEHSLYVKRRVEGELPKKNFETESLQPEDAVPRKSMYRTGNTTPARKAKFQKSASPAARYMPRSTSVTGRRRRQKVMPNLAKLFSRER